MWDVISKEVGLLTGGVNLEGRKGGWRILDETGLPIRVIRLYGDLSIVMGRYNLLPEMEVFQEHCNKITDFQVSYEYW